MDDFGFVKNNISVEEKVVNLFTFLKAMNLHREIVTTDFRNYKYSVLLRDIPKDSENISINYFDNVSNVDVIDDSNDLPFYIKILTSFSLFSIFLHYLDVLLIVCTFYICFMLLKLYSRFLIRT